MLTPHRAPNCSGFAERFVRSIEEECLNLMALFGERSLRRAIREYVEHHHEERPHQGIGNRVIEAAEVERNGEGELRREERLGELLPCYGRAA